MTQYEIRKVTDRDIVDATRLCFPALPYFESQARLIIRAAPSEIGIDFHRQIVAHGPHGVAASCLSVIMAGHGATVLAPHFANHTLKTDRPQLAADLIRAAIADCRRNGAVLIQALLDRSPDAAPADWFLAAGFRFLASLTYMQRPAVQSGSKTVPQSKIDRWQWTTYSDYDEETIGRLIEETYVSTLDCPELENIRSWRDVIDSHKASGRFDPRGWIIASLKGQLAGLALVNRMTARPACELVYMGVSPAFRGKGLGRVLVQRALEATLLLDADTLTLAVDTRNKPALKHYRRCRFTATDTRDAYFVPPAQSPTASHEPATGEPPAAAPLQ